MSAHHEKIAHLQEYPPQTPQPNIYPLGWPAGPTPPAGTATRP